MQFFGDIGGFLSILNIMGMVVANYASEFMMYNEIYKKIYYVDTSKKDA